MNGEFVDTSAWVAVFDGGDRNHPHAMGHWRELQDSRTRAYTTDYVIDESITLARRRAGHAVAVRLGNVLLASRVLRLVEVTPAIRQAAWLLFRKYDDKELSFTDCTSFVVMEQLGLSEAFAFDEDFSQVGFLRRP